MEGDADLMGFITVMLINKSKFKFAFKSTTTASELVKQACERAGIKQPQYFGLKRLRNLRSQFDEDVVPKIWMSETTPLFAHGCDSSTILHLRHKYWFYEEEEMVDPATLQIIFEETDMKMMSGLYESDEDSNIQMAACKAQLLIGDFKKDEPLSEEHAKFLLPPYIYDLHNWEEWRQLIGIFHEKLKGVPKEQVQRQYLVLAKYHCKNIRTNLFPAQYATKEMQTKVKILVGITQDGIGLYNFKQDKPKMIVFYRFKELSSWTVNPMWNGQEAPDYHRPDPSDLKFEIDPFAQGPFRATLYLKPNSRRTKDLEIELTSFLPEDDTIIGFLDTYNENWEKYISLMALDDQSKDQFIQISTLEGSSKRMRVSTETTGQELLLKYADKIGLNDSAFFQLSAVIDGCDKWISMKESVVGQGVSGTTPLTLKLRFFWKKPSDVTDPLAQNLYFTQLSQAVVNGDIPVSEEDSIELCGLYLQSTHGPAGKKKKLNYMNPKFLIDYVPFYLHEFRAHSWWVKKISAAHDKCSGLSKENAIVKYLAVVESLPNYGISYFSGMIPKTNEECYIGVGKQGLALFKFENMDLIASYRFGFELRGYTNDGESIDLHVKPTKHAEERIIVVVSLQFSEIIDMLTYYEKMRKLEKKMNQTD